MFYGLVVPAKKEIEFQVSASSIVHLSAVILNSKSAVETKVFLQKKSERFLIALLNSEKHSQVPIDLFLSPNDKVTFFSDNAEVHVIGYQENNDFSMRDEELKQPSYSHKSQPAEYSVSKVKEVFENKKSADKPHAIEKSLKEDWQHIFEKSANPQKVEKLKLVSPLLVQKQAQLFQNQGPVIHQTKPLPIAQQSKHIITEDNDYDCSGKDIGKSIDFSEKIIPSIKNATRSVKKVNPSKKSVHEITEKKFELVEIDDIGGKQWDGFAQNKDDFEKINDSEDDEDCSSLKKRAKKSTKATKSVTKHPLSKSVHKSAKKGDSLLKEIETKVISEPIATQKLKAPRKKASKKMIH
jgi:hypothetical protein